MRSILIELDQGIRTVVRDHCIEAERANLLEQDQSLRFAVFDDQHTQHF